MQRGFTIIEVSILLVIFLIVAFLVAPLSMDDTIQANNTAKWKAVQEDFSNLFYTVTEQKTSNPDQDIVEIIESVLDNEVKKDLDAPYKITYLSGAVPTGMYRFSNYKVTKGKSVISLKFVDDTDSDRLAILMYDVNGALKPNVWGKDVFGLNVYSDKIEPFCAESPMSVQKQDCKNGTGLCCSNYYLKGGSFD